MVAVLRGVIVESRSSSGTGVGAANAWREKATPRATDRSCMMKEKEEAGYEIKDR